MNVVGKALDELYRIFNLINERKFDNKLPEPVITIQKTKSDDYGSFTLDKVWKDKNNIDENNDDDETSYYEINIDPRFFYKRSAFDITETLVHEMVHYMNKICNIKDCNGKNHNKKFKIAAESAGLICERNKKYGWGITSLGEELKEFIEVVVMPEEEVFEYFRASENNNDNTKKKKRNKNFFKYTCPECGAVAKAKKDVKIICGECEVLMEIEEESEQESEIENECNN